MNRARVEAITDGIVAIAATIMVLELGMPRTPTFAGLLEEGDIFIAYILSFSMIYVTWRGHHNLFQQVETISTRTFLVNGVWIFFLTLVPFTTVWFGSEPRYTAPAFTYALNLLLWSLSFHLLDYQMRKDNPEIKRDVTMRMFDRIWIYGGYILSLTLAFRYPRIIIVIIAISTIVLGVRVFLAKDRK